MLRPKVRKRELIFPEFLEDRRFKLPLVVVWSIHAVAKDECEDRDGRNC